MPTGYSPLDPSAETSYENLVEQFEWRLPDTYNIASEALDPPDGDADRLALAHADDDGEAHRFTYGELRRATAALQTRLEELGVERGDRVALSFPQCPEVLVSHLAAYRLGAIPVPLSVILGTESFAHILDHCGVTGLIIDARVRERFADVVDGANLAFELVSETGGYAGANPALGGLSPLVSGELTEQTADTAPDDPAIVVYTSGTSGKPKGVVQRHGYLVGTLPGYQLWFEVFGDSHDETVWAPAEWAWAGALFDVVFPTLAMGGTVSSRIRRRGFDPAVALGHVDDHRVSRLFVPATALWQIREEIDTEEFDLSSLSVVMAGGEKLPAPLLRWTVENLDVAVNEAYGQTEANALVGNSSALFDVKPDSMGRPYPGHDCRIVDADGEELPPGEIGEIVLRLPDPVVFDRYWRDTNATAEVFSDGEWYHTGDLGEVDDDGYFYFRGREDDLIITAGHRVSPTEVEIAMRESPWVSEVAVGGVPDPERGQCVKAFVVLEAGTPDDREEVTRRLRTRVWEALGPYKAPSEIEYLDDPPKTRTGKLDRSKLF